MMRPHVWISLLVATVLLAGGTVLAQQVTIVISPSPIVVAPGASVQLTATVQGAPRRSRIRWSIIGPRTAGANWGSLKNNGVYTAPQSKPPGKLFILAWVLGRWSQPLVSARAEVIIQAASPLGAPSQVAQFILDGAALCRGGNTTAGQASWGQAEQIWGGLGPNDRLRAVGLIAQGQTQNVSVQVQKATQTMSNIARVTGGQYSVKMTLAQDLTNIPLTQTLPGFSYRTFQHFLCYESEIVRIRDMISAQCPSIGAQISNDVHRVIQYGSNAQTRQLRIPLTQSGYETLMAPWQDKPHVQRLAASWMIERIAAEPSANPTTCDMSIGASNSYNTNISNVIFRHDTWGEFQGKQYCGCP